MAGTEDTSATKVWMSNCTSALDVTASLRKAIDEDVAVGRMVRLTATEAQLQSGDRFRVVVLGALVKGTDTQRAPVVRVLHDGTRGINVNTHIKVQDQDAGSLNADIKRVLRVQAVSKELAVSLKFDKKTGASKPVASTAILQSILIQWGIFGVASASSRWSLVAGALVKLTRFVVGRRARFWLPLVADDLNQSCSGRNTGPALLVFPPLAGDPSVSQFLEQDQRRPSRALRGLRDSSGLLFCGCHGKPCSLGL